MNGEPRVRRRSRALSVPAGAVLFLCLFLPATDGCGEAIYPYDVWIFAEPYLLGLVVAITALRPLGADPRSLDRARARNAVVQVGGLASMAWFALWCADGGALVGLPLSLAASTGIAVGALLERRELATNRPLPAAAIGRAPGRDPWLPLATAAMVIAFAAILTSVPWRVTPQPVPVIDVPADFDRGLCLGLCGC